MLKITLIVLLMVNIRGEDELCECFCGGTCMVPDVGMKRICDKITGKCECVAGFTGIDCKSCMLFTLSSNTSKTCDCPDKNNKCLDKTKFNDFLAKLQSLKNIDFSKLQPPINIKEIEDLKKKVDQLLSDLNSSTKLNLKPFNELEKDAKDLAKNLQDILNKYENEDLLEDDEKKLNDALKIIDDLLNALEDLDNYNKIDKLVDNTKEISKNIENILDEHKKCLDVVDQFCSGKNISENLKDITQKTKDVNINEFFDRINKSNENRIETNKIDENNSKALEDIKIPNIPEFDEETIRDNHNKLENINNGINNTENTIKNATNVLFEVKKKKHESDVAKAMAFNTILMAPVQGIQDIIDNITATIKKSNTLIYELNMNKTKIEKEMERILSDLKQKDEDLKKFEERINKIKPKSDVFKTDLNMIAKWKETILNLSAEYKKKLEEYQQFERMLDEEVPKIEAVIRDNIQCLLDETKQVDEKVNANEELLDTLEKDLENVIELVNEVDKVVENVAVVKDLKDSLDKLHKDEISMKKIFCHKHSLV